MCKGRAVCARACRCKQARLLVADGAADGECVILQAILRLHLPACIVDQDMLGLGVGLGVRGWVKVREAKP